MQLWSRILLHLDTIIDAELHMSAGVQLDALPERMTWHQLGARILWLYNREGTDTRRVVRHV